MYRLSLSRDMDMAKRKRDFAALEKRRIEGMRLIGRGLNQSEVSRRLGVSTTSVRRWIALHAAQGKSGLKHGGQVGRPTRLDEDQQAQLRTLLLAGPRAQGFESALWTLRRVAQVIETTFDVELSESGTWHVLRRLGFSVQKPIGRARQRDEDAIARWKRVDWPRIKKKPRAKGARSSSSTNPG
jgi:transposase